jgi:hypothetical protein
MPKEGGSENISYLAVIAQRQDARELSISWLTVLTKLPAFLVPSYYWYGDTEASSRGSRGVISLPHDQLASISVHDVLV